MLVATVVVSILLALVFLAAGIPKVLALQSATKMRESLHVNAQLYRAVGMLELAAAAGLLLGLVVPALGIAAGVGLALLMIGGIVTHVRVGDAKGALPAAVLLLAAVAVVVLRILSM
jgi:uncharacterized membrane protein YphA (DoxX/SURF4 family)